MNYRRMLSSLTAVGLLTLSSVMAHASSHSDAPLIKQDPQANLTDVYAFVGMRGTTKVLNVIVNVHPFCEPGDGITYDRFASDALYTINITNPANGRVIRAYNFRFSAPNSGFKNPNSAFSYGVGTEIGAIQHVNDNRQNFTQMYSISKTEGGSTTDIGTNLLVPPPNVGIRTTPYYNDPTTGKAVSGATSRDTLDRYTQETVYDLPSGETVFCGSREDSFFADTPGIFDLLDPRILGKTLGQSGGGVDGFKGFNVLTYSIQIPVSGLPSIKYNAPFTGKATGVGVYASVSRRQITLRDNKGSSSLGSWVQVNRLGNPLFNEVLVANKDKDRYNITLPPDDAANYKQYALNPEVAVAINLVFGTNFVTSGRNDLAAVYIPDVLRVNTATGAVPLIGAGGNRLSFIGGDTTDGAASGWPNGRRVGDDVVDIALTAIASGPTYSSITVVGDNVAENDQVYNYVFPYVATPHSGARHTKDSGVNKE